MITIRYTDLPEGLHARAERQGRRTVIYLRRGLTAEQRRLGLRRARQSARMGYGPRLPAAGVVQAVVRDSIRGTVGTMGAVLRRHPLGSILLAAGLAAVLSSYALLVTGSIKLVLHTSPGHAASARPYPAAAHPHANPWPGAGGYPAPTAPGSSRPSPAPAKGRETTGTLATRPGAAPSDPASPAPGPSSPAPSASPSPRELCLIIGPLGVCV